MKLHTSQFSHRRDKPCDFGYAWCRINGTQLVNKLCFRCISASLEGFCRNLLIPQTFHIYTKHNVILIVNNNNHNKGTSLWEQSTFSALSQLQLDKFPWKFIFCTFFTCPSSSMPSVGISQKWRAPYLEIKIPLLLYHTTHTDIHAQKPRMCHTTPHLTHTNGRCHTTPHYIPHHTHTSPHYMNHKTPRHMHLTPQTSHTHTWAEEMTNTTQTHSWKLSMCLKQHHIHTHLTPYHTQNTHYMYSKHTTQQTHMHTCMEAEEVPHMTRHHTHKPHYAPHTTPNTYTTHTSQTIHTVHTPLTRHHTDHLTLHNTPLHTHKQTWLTPYTSTCTHRSRGCAIQLTTHTHTHTLTTQHK